MKNLHLGFSDKLALRLRWLCPGYCREMYQEELKKTRRKLLKGKRERNGHNAGITVSCVCRMGFSVLIPYIYVRKKWSNTFYFHPYLGKWSNLTNIFQMGWNHQPDMYACFWICQQNKLRMLIYTYAVCFCMFCLWGNGQNCSMCFFYSSRILKERTKQDLDLYNTIITYVI